MKVLKLIVSFSLLFLINPIFPANINQESKSETIIKPENKVDFTQTTKKNTGATTYFQNPIIPGFAPDPSICRVNDDYYLVTSSFVWFPGIPIYHSKDLVNWELIGHGITRPTQVNFNGVKDKDGIWAVTIRYHKGLFYLITTASDCGGNFYITAKDPAGPWSDPVWLKDAPGIDASLMWDDDDKCYYTGNTWNFKGSWPRQCAIWAQELNLKEQKLVGERKILTYGHANNAGNAESPHIYKIGNKYLLMIAEGGTNMYHAVTVHHSDSILKKYTSDYINPVLSHRTLGNDYPIQCVGHADLVQTQKGDWWAVVLGKRMIDGEALLSRETFLCKVNFENGTPIFNPGYGKVLSEQVRPDLPWTPVKPEPVRDEFDSDNLALNWNFIRTPKTAFYQISKGELLLKLQPEVADSLVSPAMIIQRIKHSAYSVTTKIRFSTTRNNEQAGLVVYRNNYSYYMLLKEKSNIVLIKKHNGRKEIVAQERYNKPDVLLKLDVNELDAQFSYGETANNMQKIGKVQSMSVIADSEINKFNGPGVGIYASSNGMKSTNTARFEWFDYNAGINNPTKFQESIENTK